MIKARSTLLSICVFLFVLESTAQLSLCDNPEFRLVKDINTTSYVHEFEAITEVYKESFFYTFDDGDIGTWIWRSDGSEKGTFRLPHISSEGALSNPENLLIFNEYLYFTAHNPTVGCELWRIEIESANPGDPELIEDINPGSQSSLPGQLTILKSDLCFTATSLETGYELYVFNTNTEELHKHDILKGEESSFPNQLIATQDLLFFTADIKYPNKEDLIAYDGDKSYLVEDINPGIGSNPYLYGVIRDELYFSATESTIGRELWKSDGTSAGTDVIKDIRPGSNSSGIAHSYVYKERLYFQASMTSSNRELWISDGSIAGTIEVKDINPNGSSYPKGFMGFSGEVFFEANDGINGVKLWKTDGTAGGTELLTPSGASDGIEVEELYDAESHLLIANDDELWLSQGTSGRTRPLLEPLGNPMGEAKDFQLHQGHVYFSYDDMFNEFGRELWSMDLTSLTIEPKNFYDINPNEHSSLPSYMTVVDRNMFFLAHDDNFGVELRLVDAQHDYNFLGDKSIHGGNTDHSIIYSMSHIGDTLYFTTQEGLNIWKTMGSEASTQLIDLGLSGEVDLIRTFNDLLYIFMDDEGTKEVFQSDGTLGGTHSIGGPSEGRLEYVSLAKKGLFIPYSSGELWYIEEGSTSIDLTSALNRNSSTLNFKKAVLDSIFIFTYAGNNTNDIWRSDGTLAGTTVIKDDNEEYNYNSYLERFGNKVLFNAFDSIYGDEVWVTDGTSDSTYMLLDLVPGYDESEIEKIISNGEWGIIVKKKADGDYGYWKTDGTLNGTEEIFSSSVPFYNVMEDRLGFIISTLEASGLNVDIWFADGITSGNLYVGQLNGSYGIYPTRVLGQQLLSTDLLDCTGLHAFSIMNNSFTKVPFVNNENYSFGDQVFFHYDDGVHGRELWVADCGCNDNLQVHAHDINTGHYQANASIEIEGSTKPQSKTIFTAPQEVVLNPNFIVSKYGEIEVNMNDCP